MLLPILALNLLGSLALDLSMDADHLVIVDGGLTFTDQTGLVSGLKLALTVATWLLALTAGAVATVGARRGRPVDPRTAVAVALRQFPVLALGVCMAAGVTLGALWVAASVAGEVGGGALGIVVIAGVLVALAVVGARLLLGVVTRVFGGSAWELTHGRLLQTAGVFLAGGVGFPLLAAFALQRLRAEVRAPVFMDALDAALLVGVVALQATLLARIYLQPRDAAHAMLASANLDGVDARLASLAGRRPHWTWLGAAAMVLPVLLSIRTGDSAYAVATAWPAGQHPVIATNFGARFCDTDLCDRYVERDGMASIDGWSTTTIGSDGTVVTVAATGGKETGGPFIEYAKCTRAGCQHEWLPVRASAKEPFARPSLAGAAAPDGSVWFAAAMATPFDGSGPQTYTFSMIRCAQVPCTKPERHIVDTIKLARQDGSSDSRRARMSIGADGRPVASFRLGSGLHIVTCDRITCANPRAGDVGVAPRDAAWSMPAELEDHGIALERGTLKINDDEIALASDVAQGSGALAVSGSHLYATVAEAATSPRTGLHITLGETPKSWQQVLWRCERTHCNRPERIPLNVTTGEAGRELMAVSPNGRVLIVRDDRVILLTTPPAP